MPVLIDGHNLIGQLSAVSLSDPDDEEALVRLLRVYRARTGKRITVVFDPGGGYGLAQRHHSGGVEIVFAAQGSTADAVITRRVQKSGNPQSILVVTSDRALSRTVERLGARVRDARAFAAGLEEPARNGREEDLPPGKQQPPLPSQVEEWLDIFEGNDRDAN